MLQGSDCTAESLELPKARKYGIGTRTLNSSSGLGLTQISTIGPSDESGNSAEARMRNVARRAHDNARTPQASYGFARTDHVLGTRLRRVPTPETGSQSSSSGGYAASDPAASPTLTDMVEWFKEDRKAFKLSHVEKKIRKPSTPNFWQYGANERRHNKVGDLGFSQGLTKSATLRTAEEKASIREIGPEELRGLGDCQFRAMAKRDLRQLEAEIEQCCQDNAGLHGRIRQEMESVIEKVLRTIKHGGEMDVNEAIEYNDQLFNMQRKFEDFGFSLQRAKADLARVKTLCVQMRCRCWWCKGCAGVRKLIRMYLDSLKMGNRYRRRRRMSFPL